MPRISKYPPLMTRCQNCGKEFQTNQNRLDDGRGKFCSRACHAQHTFTGMKRPPRSPEYRHKLGVAHIGKSPSNKKPTVTLICEICGKSFEVENRRQDTTKHCSRECSHEAKRRVSGTTHPLWTRVERQCEWCGKTKWVKPAKLHEFRFCSRQCQGAYTAKQMREGIGATSIERAIHEELTRRSIAFIPEYQIAVWLVDIRIIGKRIAVECDGTYWHSTPEQQQKDANKDHWLKAHGWQIIRLTEAEIKHNPVACVDRIIALFA